MKKIILSVIVTVLVMSVLGAIMIDNVLDYHNAEIEEIKTTYESKIEDMTNEYSQLEDEMENLETQVYKYMETKEPYEIEIDYDGSTHIWSGTKRGLFGDESHSAITVLSSYLY